MGMTSTQQPEQLLYQITRITNGFARLMRMKLHENMHKGTWNNCTYDYLRSRIDDELKEFDQAISEGRYTDAKCEAADVGNFFAMIIDNMDFDRFQNYNTRSRPAPAPEPTEDIDEIADICKEQLERIRTNNIGGWDEVSEAWQYVLDVLPEHDTTVARAATLTTSDRLAVLEILLDNSGYFSHTVSEIKTEYFWEKLGIKAKDRKKIVEVRESLRQQAGEQE